MSASGGWQGMCRRLVAPALAGLLLMEALAACTYLSSDGPARATVETGAVIKSERRAPVGFVQLDLSAAAVNAANAQTHALTPLMARVLSGSESRHGSIGVGDVVNITIFEASAGGLFIASEGGAPRGGNFVAIPPQQVEASGSITVPYAGQVAAAGRTPQQVARDITERLKQRAVEPQVVVSIGDRRSGSVSVLGDVNQPTRVEIDPGGLRLLEAITRGGGPRSAPYETIVTLKRGNRTTQTLLSSVVKIPDQNPYLSPGDIVFLTKEPRFYLTLGATPAPGSLGGLNNRRFTFENDTMSLAEAAAKSGGLDPNRADPGAVFLYRLESRRALEEMGVDLTGYAGNEIPTIYTCDFGRSDAFFVSSEFLMRSRDIIFVAEAPAVGLQRFTASLSGLTSNASAVAATRSY
ncbi:UNVERIFIED_ORG: polysaccharide export outer membrane protein [Methylobacterium sp. SuP10 SLI 274]|uniref:polysaccharide biosynthesis/export family protein n=1 Tax=Methylorubrum extorquens TaxID=408 RepID=UPI001AEA9C2B|nr:polysaccharide biosynthesis/export family protein [Methylorubrum extorquens]MDF9861292.1 polysaccharide export outer membrane protein [Methylorubrum pseudosasae]MDH6634921.1 polysaccharide export outer membrane protein [Methylobacterium sp. SuP10 SLI 274]MDH6664091.1 polysaccharide export outer membrane protein [Methylorubrum zatmanii]MCP1561097.1 polysaccharide export outer membrane protein [Methylorubrum extorquens]MDF9789575.1 polysaccharide export outer membrane protein [Methylorubrum e